MEQVPHTRRGRSTRGSLGDEHSAFVIDDDDSDFIANVSDDDDDFIDDEDDERFIGTKGKGKGKAKAKSKGKATARKSGRPGVRATVDGSLFMDENPRVMLISLKAGALGLNLTVASNVYLMDRASPLFFRFSNLKANTHVQRGGRFVTYH